MASEQLEVHVLPKFTSIEVLSAIGGLLFVGYIIGQLTFPVCAKFYLENQLMSQLYRTDDLEESKIDQKPPWSVNNLRTSAKVGVLETSAADMAADGQNH